MSDDLLGDLYVWSYPGWDETVRTTLGKLYPMGAIETWKVGMVTTYHLSAFYPQGEIRETLNTLLASANGAVTSSWGCNRWQDQEVW